MMISARPISATGAVKQEVMPRKLVQLLRRHQDARVSPDETRPF